MISAYTDQYAKNGKYSSNDLSMHYYMCLANDVFVSKFGRSNILFTSYKQLLDAYFPSNFIKEGTAMNHGSKQLSGLEYLS